MVLALDDSHGDSSGAGRPGDTREATVNVAARLATATPELGVQTALASGAVGEGVDPVATTRTIEIVAARVDASALSYTCACPAVGGEHACDWIRPLRAADRSTRTPAECIGGSAGALMHRGILGGRAESVAVAAVAATIGAAARAHLGASPVLAACIATGGINRCRVYASIVCRDLAAAASDKHDDSERS